PWRPEVYFASLSPRTRRGIAAGALVLAAFVPVAVVIFGGGAGGSINAPVMATDYRAADDAASRGYGRGDPTPYPKDGKPDLKDGKPEKPSTAPGGTQAAPPSAPGKAAPPAAPKKVAPVAGLSQDQMDNAALIVHAGQKAHLPKRAYVIAVATSM